jgi:hypothetical protein
MEAKAVLRQKLPAGARAARRTVRCFWRWAVSLFKCRYADLRGKSNNGSKRGCPTTESTALDFNSRQDA